MMWGSLMAHESQFRAPGLTKRVGGQSNPTSELSSRVGLRLLGHYAADPRRHPAALVWPSIGHRVASYPSPISRP